MHAIVRVSEGFVHVYGLCMYMVCTCIWSVHVYGLYMYMVCTCIWSVHVYGLYMYMVCACYVGIAQLV